MLYDEVLERLGQFGRYQKRVYFLLCLPVITTCIQTFMSVFSLAVPEHRCAIPGLPNDTFAVQNSHHAALINATIPPGDSCHLLTSRNVTLSGDDVSYDVIAADVSAGGTENGGGGGVQGGNGSEVVLVACSRFVYDRSLVEENLVTEMVGSGKRVWAGYVMEVFWALGMILLAPMAFLLRDWHWLQVASGLLPFAFLSYFWLIPESPRWLLTKGRVAEAEAILRKAARVNRVELPEGCVDVHSVPRGRQEESLWAVCGYPVLVYRCGVIFLTWFVCSLGFYGLSLNVGMLAGSVHLNVLLSGLMEVISMVLCMCLLDRLGRRPLNASLLLLAGLACTCTIFTTLYAPDSHKWTTTALAMIGKLGIAGAFATVWLYSTELFPTCIRNSSLGVSSGFARVGSIVSPYIANLSDNLEGDAATAVPLLIFGLSSILAGLLLLTLPETLNRRLPDTITDAINFTKKGREELDGFQSVPQEEKLEENGKVQTSM